jgi:hypothetical protein
MSKCACYNTIRETKGEHERVYRSHVKVSYCYYMLFPILDSPVETIIVLWEINASSIIPLAAEI